MPSKLPRVAVLLVLSIASLLAGCGGEEPSRVAVPLGDSPQRGPPDAWVTIVEFSDFQCPFCKAAEPTLQRLLLDYAGELRLVYMHKPLDVLHAFARPAAIASECANAQQKFWEMHDQLFLASPDLDEAHLTAAAGQTGLDLQAFATCEQSEPPRTRVATDEGRAEGLGVTGTPTFFINGRRVSGAQPYESFRAVVEEELSRARQSGIARERYYDEAVLEQ